LSAGSLTAPARYLVIPAPVETAATFSTIAPTLLELFRDLGDEAAGQFVACSPMKSPGASIGEIEAVPGPGHPDIAEPSLFFEALLVH
jgi:hypothetical protein